MIINLLLLRYSQPVKKYKCQETGKNTTATKNEMLGNLDSKPPK